MNEEKLFERRKRMNIFTKRNKKTNLEMEIDSILEYMSTIKPESDGYTAIASNLEMLYRAKGNEKLYRVSPDTIAIVVCSLIEVLLMLHYEKIGVITSKVLGRILRGRV